MCIAPVNPVQLGLCASMQVKNMNPFVSPPRAIDTEYLGTCVPKYSYVDTYDARLYMKRDTFNSLFGTGYTTCLRMHESPSCLSSTGPKSPDLCVCACLSVSLCRWLQSFDALPRSKSSLSQKVTHAEPNTTWWFPVSITLNKSVLQLVF